MSISGNKEVPVRHHTGTQAKNYPFGSMIEPESVCAPEAAAWGHPFGSMMEPL
jgi:hypothetical protein